MKHPHNHKDHFPGLKVSFLKNKKQVKKVNPFLQENHFALLLIRKGKIDLQMMSDTVLLQPGELVFLSEETSSAITAIHGQPFIGIVLFSRRFAFRAMTKTIFSSFLIFPMLGGFPRLQLNTHEVSLLYLLMTLLDMKSKALRYPQSHNQVLDLGFYMLLWELGNLYRHYNRDESFLYTMKHIWFMRYFDAIRIYYKKHHRVQFYADELHVSTRYLSKTVKDVSGKTAKKFLRDFLLEEAKMLLHAPVPIKVISHTLGFNSVQHFSNFFRRHTAITPTAFRKSLNEKSIV
ncbi:helix-turn-helix domain-containing protein [Sinomicrobium oceani]|uniref:helix-turn-helix domain-containing protein n=1 Tax=Sinomicrobium oceani TaxID=1150368 RepID=UPI00227D4EFB|nr:helix-turn-helix domain-containing protein [Sinomicrobium oceani]